MKEIGNMQNASSRNHKTLTLTILGECGYKFGIKKV